MVEHAKEKVYVPTLIFGHLLTSSNYDDSEKKVTGDANLFQVLKKLSFFNAICYEIIYDLHSELNFGLLYEIRPEFQLLLKRFPASLP